MNDNWYSEWKQVYGNKNMMKKYIDDVMEEAEVEEEKNCLIIEIRYLLCTLTFHTIE